MSKENFKLALHAIEQISEFEVNTEQHKAIKQNMTYFEVAFDLVNLIDKFIDVEIKATAHDLNNIRNLIKYTKTGKKC